jgi:hypothetical protein
MLPVLPGRLTSRSLGWPPRAGSELVYGVEKYLFVPYALDRLANGEMQACVSPLTPTLC